MRRLRLSLEALLVVVVVVVLAAGTGSASGAGPTIPAYSLHLATSNSSSDTPSAGDRSYAWRIFNSGNTPWMPPDTDYARHGDYFQSGDGTAWWGAISIRVDSPVPALSRFWNFHVLDGYPGWSSDYAHSPDAVDVQTENGQTVLRFNVDGGGTWDPSIQFYRDTNKLNGQSSVDFPITLGVRQDIVLEIRFAPDGDGLFGAWVNGKVAVSQQSVPTMYPGVAGIPSGNAQGVTGLQELVGGYEDYAGATQAAEGYWFSAPRWGTSLAAALTDVPVSSALGDHSVATGSTGTASSISAQPAFNSSLFKAPNLGPVAKAATKIVHSTVRRDARDHKRKRRLR